MQAFLRALLLGVNTHWNAKIPRIQRRTVSDYLNHTATNHRLGLVFKENRNLSTSSTTLGTKKEFEPRSQRRPARNLLFWRIKWIMIAQKTIKPCSSACHRNKSLPRKRNSFVLLHCDQDWWAPTLGCGAGRAAQLSCTTSFFKKVRGSEETLSLCGVHYLYRCTFSSHLAEKSPTNRCGCSPADARHFEIRFTLTLHV